MKPAMFLNMGVKPHLGSRQTLGSQVLEWGNNFKIVEILRQQLKKKSGKENKGTNQAEWHCSRAFSIHF
jgi:hypothetical protein